MQDTPIAHVSDTAFWVATYRALESEREDALFKDPLAALLVGKRGPDIARRMKRSRTIQWSVVIRTCIIDEYISDAIKQGVDTVLNLGAGLDTRPYRMSLPENLNWIEIDYPKLIEFKETRLHAQKPTCKLTRIPLDLSRKIERQRTLSEINAQAKKVLVLTEGVIPYLSNKDAEQLAHDLFAQSHFNFWALEYFSADAMRYMKKGKFRKQMRHAPFLFKPKNWTQFFDKTGWKIKQMRYTKEEGDKRNRPVPLSFWLKPFRFMTRLIPQVRQMTGFAFLEKK